MKRMDVAKGGNDVSARERAYEGIRSRLLTGVFGPGTFVEEVAMAEAVGVSRSPVREALHRLAAEGYLDLHPRRGAMVRPILAAELRDFCEVRLMIESRAIEKICSEKRKVPAELEDLCDQQASIPIEDVLANVETNWLFHRAIVATAGNVVLLQVFDGLRANNARVSVLARKSSADSGGTIVREHRELLVALEAHDRDAALDALVRHLRMMPQLLDTK
ncbi:GntR family transcriptional regulator [uncultured Jannaschia sp.]|uniref:GntR family transcriptional regulator n=1 Tax=uncultured Jannaschia sp. TaxID=293347 RepID=UPI002621D3B5|nr:GntR family transcriptional regulator [uncultured Jannaschia sp.]